MYFEIELQWRAVQVFQKKHISIQYKQPKVIMQVKEKKKKNFTCTGQEISPGFF